MRARAHKHKHALSVLIRRCVNSMAFLFLFQDDLKEMVDLVKAEARRGCRQEICLSVMVVFIISILIYFVMHLI
jgi:hypothetical protein